MAEETRKHWEKVDLKQSKQDSTDSDPKNSPRFVKAKKELLHIINWQINDDKHRKLEQIEATLRHLLLISNNILDHPDEEKYRQIRILNPIFDRHVRSSPGGDDFMIVAGFHAEVRQNERYFVFSHQPHTIEWKILQEARNEAQKFQNLVTQKIEKSDKSSAAKKKELEERKQTVLGQLEEDKEIRSRRFRYGASE